MYIDQPIRQGMRYLFDNKFTKAKTIFESKSKRYFYTNEYLPFNISTKN